VTGRGGHFIYIDQRKKTFVRDQMFFFMSYFPFFFFQFYCWIL
jgi:hypothetical protein